MIFSSLVPHLHCTDRERFREVGTKVSWVGKYLKYAFLLLRFMERELVAKKQLGDNRKFRAQSQAN